MNSVIKPLGSILIKSLESLDPELWQPLQSYRGQSIGIKFTDLESLSVFLIGERVKILSDATDANTVLSGTTLNFVNYCLHPEALPKQFDINIHGNPMLAQSFLQALQGIQIPWEQPFVRIFGKTLGYQFYQQFRKRLLRSQDSIQDLKLDIKEYLQHEAKLLIGQGEAQRLYQDIDSLYHSAQCLDARLNLLKAT